MRYHRPVEKSALKHRFEFCPREVVQHGFLVESGKAVLIDAVLEVFEVIDAARFGRAAELIRRLPLQEGFSLRFLLERRRLRALVVSWWTITFR